MYFINHHPLQPAEHFDAVGIGKQQRQAFRCRQQDMRWPCPLALLAVGRRISATGSDPDWQVELFDRRQKIALHVMRQCLERGHIKGVQTLGWLTTIEARGREIGQRREKARECLPSPGVGHQQGVPVGIAGAQHINLMTPDTPAASGKPTFQFWRHNGLHHDRSDGAVVSVPPPRVCRVSTLHFWVEGRLVHRFGRLYDFA